MADTRQVVSWSLERKCAFRKGSDWFLPNKTHQQLAYLRTLANAQKDDRIVSGICVTSWSTGKDHSGNYHDIPHDGFRIGDKIGKFGGLSDVLKTCGGCEANADNQLETKIAGCCGHLDIWPASPELDEQLWKVIEERGLEDRLRSAFLPTTPLWYGFWAESPLRRLQVEFLHELLDATCDYDDPQDRDVAHFLSALKAAINWELPIHVSLAPLGHTDFGWYTVFPHCPRCKATAQVGRWKEEFPSEPYKCKICEYVFNPNEHHSSKRDGYDWEATSLEKQLGDDGYQQFTKQFLLHRGCTEKQVEEVIDNENDGPLVRQIASVRRQRKATLQRLRQNLQPNIQGSNFPRNTIVALTEHIDLELILVPAGEFFMGSADSEERPAEAPRHLVRFERPFYIGRFPVTQAQWQAVMGNNVSRHKGPDLPVDQASWFDCQNYCEELCSRQQRIFRLPSEAEWEYACRAGTMTRFAFGDSLSVQQAHFTPYSEMLPAPPKDELEAVRGMEILADAEMANQRVRKEKPTPVGSYPPNAWGIYDMHGNVDEWCEDVWHDSYEGAPTDGTAWLSGEDRQPFRVMRGGWFSATEFVCTSTSRHQVRADAGSRDQGEIDDEDDDILAAMFDMMYVPYGFRVVCEL